MARKRALNATVIPWIPTFCKNLSADLGYTAADDAVLAALGAGDLSVNRVVATSLSRLNPRRLLGNLLSDRRSIRIQDMNDLMIQFGKCLYPYPR